MNKTFALILIFVSSCALCCSRFRWSTIAASVQSPSVDEQRPVAPASCPVTVPPTTPFTPPGEQEMGANDNDFWLGTEKLWIALPKSGEVWGWVPHAPGHEHDLTAKIFWGSVDFDYRKEYPPQLKVTGRRLDGDAPPLLVEKVTNALFVPHAAMLTGVWAPAPGCWEITGDYRGQKLSFVVWVYPVKQGNE
jgi:hypothetical protein